ncbi:MAG TPA: hypothetical protein VK203_07070 [Nostocaceae cyanobacterium]|nr:hypothetical protein [Nostocaceae cyanobacterium]
MPRDYVNPLSIQTIDLPLLLLQQTAFDGQRLVLPKGDRAYVAEVCSSKPLPYFWYGASIILKG